jgi:probable F420-dependent oxidoreductase
MSNVRIAVQLQPQHAHYASIRDALLRTEDMGVDIAYNWDHFFPLSGEVDGQHFECWTMLGAWAEQTSRIEIGTLVTCNSYRNPQLLADMARTVDHMSDGRLILGIGSGWFKRDYDEYGFEFGTKGSRLDDLGKALPIIEQRWSQLNPPPTREIPILIGGGGEQKTLRFAAKHADIWHFFGTPQEMAHKASVLDRRCDEIGRDKAEIERSVGIGIEKGFPDAQAFYDLGFRQFTFGVSGPDYDLSGLDKWLAWRDEVNAVA